MSCVLVLPSSLHPCVSSEVPSTTAAALCFLVLIKGEEAVGMVVSLTGVAMVTGITGMAAVAMVSNIAQVAVVTGGEVTSPPFCS